MSRNDAAVGKSIFSCIGTRRAASTRHSSANAPWVANAITRSPGFALATPGPTAFTTPAISAPGVNGGVALTWYLFWMMRTSGKLTLAAFTDTTTWPGPACGGATSSTSSDSGGPNCLHTTAFISIPPSGQPGPIIGASRPPRERRFARRDRVLSSGALPARRRSSRCSPSYRRRASRQGTPPTRRSPPGSPGARTTCRQRAPGSGRRRRTWSRPAA